MGFQLEFSALQCFTDLSFSKCQLRNIRKHNKDIDDYDLDVINSIHKATACIIDTSRYLPVDLLKFLNSILNIDYSTHGKFSLKPMQMSGINEQFVPSINEAKVIINSGIHSDINDLIIMMFNLWRVQLFYDANKRTAYFFTNYYLIHKFHKILILKSRQLDSWHSLLGTYFKIGKCKQLINLVHKNCLYQLNRNRDATYE